MIRVKISELIKTQIISDETMFEASLLLDGVLVSRSVTLGTMKEALGGLGAEWGVITGDIQTQADLINLLDAKVDKISGMGLSENNFTNALKAHLEGLEGTHWRGVFPNEAALIAGATNPVAGDYADVDMGVGHDAERFIWDASDSKWVPQRSAAPLTAAQVKQLFLSNPDTNNFDDAAELKLDSIAAGATKNATDAFLLSRDNHTGTQPISTVSGLAQALNDAGKTAESNTIDYKIKTIADTSYEITDADNGYILWFTSASDVSVSLGLATISVNCVLIQGGDGVVSVVSPVVSLDDAVETIGKGAAASLVYNAAAGAWWLGGGIE